VVKVEITKKGKIKGKVYSLNISKIKGVTKKPVKEVLLVENWGVKGDAHAEGGIRQISLLALEIIEKQKKCPKIKSGKISLNPGDFAENITTKDLDLTNLQIGDKLKIGENVIIEISKIGKECHKYCAIYYKTGDCIMPREGIFAKVIKGGSVRTNDIIEVIND
jgi:MOSC domain-containing protein YiiM